jgi:stage II sporulation protein M
MALSPKMNRKLIAHFKEHFSRYLLLIFLFFTGALCGVFSVSTLSEHGRFSSIQYTGALIQGLAQQIPDLGSTFLWSFLMRFGSLFLLYLGAILCIGAATTFVLMLCYGFSMGFTVTLFFHSAGIKAGIILLGALLPAAYVFVVWLYASNLAMATSRSLRTEAMRRSRMGLADRARSASGPWMPVAAAMFLGVLLEVLISPLLMHFLARILV